MNQDHIKKALMEQALQIVPFEGWGRESLKNINIAAGFVNHTDELVFPSGVIEMIEYCNQYADKLMLEAIKNFATGMKVREKIAAAIFQKFSLYQKHRAFVSKTFSVLCIPQNILHTQKMAWNTVDLIWYEAGLDRSVDFNYYTKRGLLLAVYNASFMYWLSDDSLDFVDTKQFVMQRLDEVVQIGGKLGKALKRFSMV